MPGTRKLGKTSDQRMAMLRQQVTDFLDNGKMETTITRAKEIKPMAEKMITLGKKADLAAYRQAMSFITREDVCKKIFKEIAPKYAERNGGYTREQVNGGEVGRYTTSASGEKLYHKVKAGETLMSIAEKRGVSVEQICRLNGYRKDKKLSPGQIIRYS